MIGIFSIIGSSKGPSPALFAANLFITAAGYTNTDVIAAIKDLFVEIYGLNLQSRIKKAHIFTTDKTVDADRLNQFKWNIFNPLDTDAAFRLTYVNSPPPSYSGLGFNGTTQYAETFFNYNTEMPTLADDVGMMSFYTGTTPACCGTIDTTSAFRINQTILNNGTQTNGALSTNTGTASTHASATGSFAVKRETGGIQKIWYQGAADGTATTTTQGVPATHTENRGRTNGTAIFWGSSGCCFHSTFTGFSDAEVLSYMDAVNRYQGKIDTAFSLSGVNARKKY